MAAFGWRPAVGILGALVLLAWRAAVPSALTPDSRETLAKDIPLTRGGRLVLDNSLGDVTIRAWNREQVELRAEKTADSAAELAELPIEIDATGDALTITSRAPVYRPEMRVRVDYRLRVPADTDLKLVKADRGLVAIEGVVGRAVVRVVNGAVRIRDFAGVLDVSTLNGEIDGQITRLRPGDTVTLETYNGDILLRVPGGANAHYALRTFNGRIESSTPLPVVTTFGPSVAHESHAVEDPLVRLTSVNGTIRVSQ